MTNDRLASNHSRAVIVSAAVFAAGNLQAQQRIPPRPITPPAAFQEAVANGTRSIDGSPGPAYWQQRADYLIEASLDPESGRIRGRETITYRNNSPDALEFLMLRLEQNVFAEGARRNRRAPVTGGVSVDSVTVNGVPVATAHPGRGYYESLTLLQLHLEAPLPPGAEARIELVWTHVVPPAPTFRTANLDNTIFAVAQWYPRMAVYDDVYGWDFSPYLGDGEFYLEYGDFDVSLTVPAGWLIAASGTLVNPDEVLAEPAAAALRRAAVSRSKVAVVAPEQRGVGRATAGRAGERLTWRFRAENVRDFAWATSDEYVWDAATTEGGVLAQAFYRPHLDAWSEGISYVIHTVESLSRYLGDYAYPQLTIAEGPVGGMEYPMLIFNPSTNNPRGLAGVTIHEGAHQWFPMMVGSMEAKHTWMDEGFVSYWDEISARELRGEGPPTWGDNGYYLQVAGTEAEVPLMRHTDLVNPYGARGLAAYSKPAIVLGALREVVGDDVFQRAFRTYVRLWTFKHPQPWDFFATVEHEAGQDLGWFWRPLVFETDVLDHAVAGVVVSEGTTTISIRDRGEVVLPAVVQVRGEGRMVEVVVPVSHWLAGNRVYDFAVDWVADTVTIDPSMAFPDVNRANNTWIR